MTNETNTTEVVNHRDAKLADLREDLIKAYEKVAKIEEKIESIEREIANADAIKAIAPGTSVTYVFGRAANKRVLSGTVRVLGENDKNVVQLKVESGEGFDAEFHLIDASALLLDQSQIDAAYADIEAAKAEAESKAAEKAAASEGSA